MRTPALRRSVSALLVTSCFVLVGTGTTAARPEGAGGPDDSALGRLRADAATRVEVLRGTDGRVHGLRAPDGARLVAAPTAPTAPQGASASPAEAARVFVRRYAGGLRDSGVAPQARTTGTTSLGAGRVVALQQQLDGVPVVGGELRVVLDGADGLRALTGELSEADALPAATLAEQAARRTARALVKRDGGIARVEDRGLWAFDPRLVGELGEQVRPAWRFEVSGAATSSDVLVDAQRGTLLLATSERHELYREVCNGANQPRGQEWDIVACNEPARAEGQGPNPASSVNQAYDAIGRTSDLYTRLGVDLTEMIGVGPDGSRVIEAWVNYCPHAELSDCPMDNAYWDGHRIALGEGYAAADDVVAHELSHGVIERTADLMYLHQSGAINESFADIFGELLDQQAPDAEDAEWLLGEALPGGPLRSMATPSIGNQPAKMTSTLYGTAPSWVDAGDVHTNSGIGNKAAWLIAHGGSFNGQDVSSIDTGATAPYERSLQLWYATLLLLTSGSEYAELATALETACANLATAATAGITATHCQEVEQAVLATEMRERPLSPGAEAADVTDACAPGETRQTLFRDDDAHPHPWERVGSGQVAGGGVAPLWTQDPAQFLVDEYASEGKLSWAGVAPLAEHGDYQSPMLTLPAAEAVTVPTGVRTYLRFRHAYDLEVFEGKYYDGGRVYALTLQDGAWRPAPVALPWVNGPNRTLQTGTDTSAGGSGPAFSGDSRGWGSSRLELTGLAGQAVRPRFRIWADDFVAAQGWWVDEIEVYSCASAAPSAVQGLTPAGSATGVTLRWKAPVQHGGTLASYRVARSDGDLRVVPAGTTAIAYPTLPAGATVAFAVTPVDTDGEFGPAVTVTVVRTRATLASSATSVVRGRSVTLTGRLVRTDTGGALAGLPVVFQRRAVGGTTWATIATRTTGTLGKATLTLSPTAGYDYRVRFPGRARWVGDDSGIRRVAVR